MRDSSKCFFSICKEAINDFSDCWTKTAWFALFSISRNSMFLYSIIVCVRSNRSSNPLTYLCRWSDSTYNALILSFWNITVASFSILHDLSTNSSSLNFSIFSLWISFNVSRVNMSWTALSYLACKSLWREWRPFNFDSNCKRNWTSSSWVFNYLKISSFNFWLREVCSVSFLLRSLYLTAIFSNSSLRLFSASSRS